MMNKLSHKISGITLIELCVTMFITSIVLGSGLFGLRYVNAQKKIFQENNQSALEMKTFRNQVESLMWDCDTIYIQDESTLEFIRLGERITLSLDQIPVIERMTLIDSLDLEVTDVSFESLKNPDLLSSIDLTIAFHDEKLRMNFKKEYDLKTQMAWE